MRNSTAKLVLDLETHPAATLTYTTNMKKSFFLIVALFAALMCRAEPPSTSATSDDKDTANYVIHVEWNGTAQSNSLEVLTADGGFNLSTIQKNSVKINNNDIPITLKFEGELKVINSEKGRLKIFLGRTIPYVTGTASNGLGMQSSYSQMSVGLDSSFIVTFGKPLVIQSDDNGQVTIVVKRAED